MVCLFNAWDLNNNEVAAVAANCNLDYRKQNSSEYKTAVNVLANGKGYLHVETDVAHYFAASYRVIPAARFDKKDFDYEYQNHRERFYTVYIGVPMFLPKEDRMTYYSLLKTPIKAKNLKNVDYEIIGGIDGGANSTKTDESMIVLIKQYFIDDVAYLHIWKTIRLKKGQKKLSPSLQAQAFYKELVKLKCDMTLYGDPRAW